MSHGKALLIGAVGTVQGRLGWAHQTIKQIFDDYEPVLTSSDWLKEQEFECVHYVMRFGAEKKEKIEIRKINKYKELPVASQLSMDDLHEVFLNKPKLREFLEQEVRRVLFHVKDKFHLPAVPELEL
ncbi:MAG: hypothetical protein CL583_07635 [Alteromonadaceae bacterium]|nr:hypothetical protein [Alteromonadaceae bacterium]|tara:strand:- start:346 stop:726 length:381 start_codon:yes stop_codon:yes gene_type:complete